MTLPVSFPSIFVSDPEQVRFALVPIYIGMALLWNIVAYTDRLTKAPEGWSFKKARLTLYLGALVGIFIAILDPALLSPPVMTFTGLLIPVLDEIFHTFGNIRKQVAHSGTPSWSEDWFQ